MSHSLTDAGLARVCAVAAGMVVVMLLTMLVFLTYEAWPALPGGGVLHLFMDEAWYPTEGKFALLPMIIATLASAAGAMLIALPIGLASAIFQNFYAPPMIAHLMKMAVALLAGIPSVVFGLWGLVVAVPLIARWHQPGASLLAAIVILAMMILPTISATAAAALHSVPAAYLRGGAALGLTRTTQILSIALPAARYSIVGGILLAAGRALGETMAVLMVAGNVIQMPTSLFDPVRVLTANIALEMAYASGVHRAALFATGLVLASLVLALSGLSSRYSSRALNAAP